jgi:hypothetical protein
MCGRLKRSQSVGLHRAWLQSNDRIPSSDETNETQGNEATCSRSMLGLETELSQIYFLERFGENKEVI